MQRADYGINIIPVLSDYRAMQMLKPAESLLTRYFHHFPFVVSRFWAMELWAHMDSRLVWGPTSGDSKCLGWRRFLASVTNLLTAGAFWKKKQDQKGISTHPRTSSGHSRINLIQSIALLLKELKVSGQSGMEERLATSENLKTKSFLFIITLLPWSFLIKLFL